MLKLLTLKALPNPLQEFATDGFDRLTTREREIAQAIIDGQTSKQTANSLRISPRTVEIHRARVFQKLGIRGATDLVRFVATIKKELAPQSLGQEPSVELARRDLAIIASSALIPDPNGTASMADILTGIAYRRQPDPEAISVLMTWDRTGGASGYLLVPVDVERRLLALSYPPPDTTRPLISAISYGLFLALQEGISLHLTGDRAVWDKSWGQLPAVTEGPGRSLM
ncbi:MAG: helix-turn-helix transcriptional regulator [Devosia sp.]